MAKRLNLKIDYFEGFSVLSIASQLKDYRLTYFVNEALEIDLKKYEDFRLDGKKGSYSWFYFRKGENCPTFYLVSNHHPEGKLFASQKGIDFYLFIKDTYSDDEILEKIVSLRKIKGILGVFPINLSSIKMMDSVIESLELHELENIIKPKSTMPGSL